MLKQIPKSSKDQCNDQRWIITFLYLLPKLCREFTKIGYSSSKIGVIKKLYQQLVILHCVFISGISLREVNEAIQTSPRFETSTAEKTFTTISYQRREGAEPDLTPIIAVPEMTLNDSLPAANPIQFTRTYYLVKLITCFHNS